MKVEVLRVEHFDRMESVTMQPKPMMRHLVMVYAAQGPAYAGMTDEGRVICLAGLRKLHPGVAEGWAIMAKDMPQYRRWLHRTVKTMLDEHIRFMGLRRVQISVEASFQAACRWAEHLGFVNETPNGMRRFGPNGEPHFMYARTQ